MLNHAATRRCEFDMPSQSACAAVFGAGSTKAIHAWFATRHKPSGQQDTAELHSKRATLDLTLWYGFADCLMYVVRVFTFTI